MIKNDIWQQFSHSDTCKLIKTNLKWLILFIDMWFIACVGVWYRILEPFSYINNAKRKYIARAFFLYRQALTLKWLHLFYGFFLFLLSFFCYIFMLSSLYLRFSSSGTILRYCLQCPLGVDFLWSQRLPDYVQMHTHTYHLMCLKYIKWNAFIRFNARFKY